VLFALSTPEALEGQAVDVVRRDVVGVDVTSTTFVAAAAWTLLGSPAAAALVAPASTARERSLRTPAEQKPSSPERACGSRGVLPIEGRWDGRASASATLIV